MSDGLFCCHQDQRHRAARPAHQDGRGGPNLANAETTRTDEGTPYRRQRAIFEQVLGEQAGQTTTSADAAGHRGAA